jgi:hypothetical protein
MKQGTGGIAETGTLNPARQLDDKAAFIKMARVTHAIELSEDLMRAVDQKDFVYAGDAVKMHMKQAEIAMSRVENEMLNGTGDALLAAITVGTGPSATITVGTTANFYQLYPGRVVDLLVRATGATGSLARTIVSNDPVAGTVTLDASVTTLNTWGIYIEGTYGNAVQGLRQPFATSGTFQGIDLATVPQFRGTEGRATGAGAADLSMAILNGAFRRVMEATGETPDFFVGDPAVLDKYGESLVAQFRWEPKIATLSTGWSGIEYKGIPLIPDPDQPAGEIMGVNKSAITLYGYNDGPVWDERTGSKFMRFSRSLPSEAWLIDWLQLGIHQPNALVRALNLNRAA